MKEFSSEEHIKHKDEIDENGAPKRQGLYEHDIRERVGQDNGNVVARLETALVDNVTF
ncbi:MAG: hypothetical protein WCB27_19765 [Thermoguttaceae bacterium]